MRTKILVLSRLVEDIVRLDAERYEIVRWWEATPDQQVLLARGARLAVAIGYETVDRDVFGRASDLGLICTVGAGCEGIDQGAAAERGVRIATASGINAGDVADHAVGMFIAARRNLLGMDRWVRDGSWAAGRAPVGRSLSLERVGIVGLGAIGEAIARRVEPIVAEVAWWGPRPKHDAPLIRTESLLDLARRSTTLFVACALSEATRCLINRATMDALGSDGLLVNVARGAVIDEEALVAALREGRLGHAALDVFAEEPTPAARWADVPNLLLSPHVAGATEQAVAAAVANVHRNLEHFHG